MLCAQSPMSHDAICAWLALQKVGFTACAPLLWRLRKEDAKGAAALTQLPLVGPESGVAAGAGGGAGGGGGVPLGA